MTTKDYTCPFLALLTQMLFQREVCVMLYDWGDYVLFPAY